MSDEIIPIESNPLAMVPAAMTVPAISDSPVSFTAENADEMAQCQNGMIAWAQAKVEQVRKEAFELKVAYDHAVKQKWSNSILKRHAGLAVKRLDFYERLLTALEHGYQIVPSFPITAFAIRTDRKKPLKMWTTEYYKSHTQEPTLSPAGEGEYKNPFPYVEQMTTNAATQNTAEKRAYWAEAWKELEFPFSMSKPRIMEATTRAMALKIFDDIGILPGYATSEGTRAPAGDPLIIARLKVPKLGAYNSRYISFIIAWHLDVSDL